jgi:hypothetical protein
MTEKRPHPIRNGIIVGVSVAGLISLTTWLIPGGWNWVKIQALGSWAWLLTPATIPTWLALCLGIAAVTLVIILAAFALLARRSSKVIDYGEDNFFDILWRWKYGTGGIHSICAFCPTCDLQIGPRQIFIDSGVSETLYHCENCRSDVKRLAGTAIQIEERVEREVQRKIRAKVKAMS